MFVQRLTCWLANDVPWTSLWNALAALGNLALAFMTFRIIRREIQRERKENEPFVRLGSVAQSVIAGSGMAVATTKFTMNPEVSIANLGKHPIHVEAAMWWTDRMQEYEGVLPRTQYLNLTIPSGVNTVAHLDMTLTISKWGWLRFYFRNGATSDEYPYIEVPMFLDPYADEGTEGHDEQESSLVLFDFDKQELGSSTAPWHKERHTFKGTDDQALSLKYVY